MATQSRAKKLSELPVVTATDYSDYIMVVANSATTPVTSVITNANWLGSLIPNANPLQDGAVHYQANTQTLVVDFQYLYTVDAPATASSNGTAGTMAFDSTHLYYCVANNQWVRAELSSW
jgi:hypothetical protein